jgi:hypothetical protein
MKNIKERVEENIRTSKRPDMTFILYFFLGVVALVAIVNLIPYLSTAWMTKHFTQFQLQKAMGLTLSDFSMRELAGVNLEVKSFEEYKDFFKTNPFSDQNSGAADLAKANTVMPLIVFGLQYILPPFLLGYIVWFLAKFWTYITAGILGFFVTTMNYIKDLAIGIFGCEKFFRMMFPKLKCSKNIRFSSYYNSWFRRYVENPIRKERLNYLKKIDKMRKEYVEGPINSVITKPLQQLSVEAQFTKEVYVDRAKAVAEQKLKDDYVQRRWGPQYTFYNMLFGDVDSRAGFGEYLKYLFTGGGSPDVEGYKRELVEVGDDIKESVEPFLSLKLIKGLGAVGAVSFLLFTELPFRPHIRGMLIISVLLLSNLF